jgi:hypothetical protein
MPKKDGTILVAEIPSEPMRYRVESWTSKYPHTVDLSMNDGSGACSCADFSIRRQTAVDEGQPLFTRATQCKHIRAAVEHWKRTTLQMIAADLHRGKVKPLTRAPVGLGKDAASISTEVASSEPSSKPTTSAGQSGAKSQTGSLRLPERRAKR